VIDAVIGSKTPLHYAAMRGQPEVMDILLNAGANPNAKSVCDLECEMKRDGRMGNIGVFLTIN
jgi:ankyrin repeat protein